MVVFVAFAVVVAPARCKMLQGSISPAKCGSILVKPGWVTVRPEAVNTSGVKFSCNEDPEADPMNSSLVVVYLQFRTPWSHMTVWCATVSLDFDRRNAGKRREAEGCRYIVDNSLWTIHCGQSGCLHGVLQLCSSRTGLSNY